MNPKERVLLALEDGAKCIRELLHATGLTRPKLGKALQRLREAGLVERDEESETYRLTGRGREEVERIRLHLLLDQAVEKRGLELVQALLLRAAEVEVSGDFIITARRINYTQRVPLRWLYEKTGRFDRLEIPWRKHWVGVPGQDGWIEVAVTGADAILSGEKLTLTIGGVVTVTLNGESELERFIADVLQKRKEALEERLTHAISMTPKPYSLIADIADELDLITNWHIEAELLTHTGKTLTLLSAPAQRFWQ